MAFDRNFSVSLRYFFLIAFLILIIHALSSDYGVNGEDQLEKNPSNPDKPADNRIVGPKGSDTNEATKRPAKKRKPRSSLSPPGSVTVKMGVEDPKQAPGKPKDVPQQIASPVDNDVKGRIGATGTPKAVKAVAVNTDEDDENEDDKDDGKDVEKENKKDDIAKKDEKETSRKKPSNTGDAAENKNNAPLRKKPVTDDVSSAGSFMTYFVIVAIIVIIAYLILHNKKKLMAYIVEGRNTGRARRQRPTSGNGSEYKPLKNADEAPGGRPEEA